MTTNNPATIDDYISAFPSHIQKILEEIRATIKQEVPQAEEAIKYAMPTFVLNGNLVHFAAFKNHIGFYPAPLGITSFKKDLTPYSSGKGSVQFPLNGPMPLELIKKIVQFRVKEVSSKGPAKKKVEG